MNDIFLHAPSLVEILTMTSNRAYKLLTPARFPLEETIAVTPVPQATSTVDRRSVLSEEIDVHVDSDMPGTNQLITAMEELHSIVDSAKKSTSPPSSLGLLDTSFSDFSVTDEDGKEIIDDLTRRSLTKGFSFSSELKKKDSSRMNSALSDVDIDLRLRLQRALAQSLLDKSHDCSDIQECSVESRVSQEHVEEDGNSFLDSKSDDWTHRITNMMNALIIEHSPEFRDSDVSAGPNEEVVPENEEYSMQSTSTKIVTQNPFSGSDVGANEDLQTVFQEYASEEFISADEVIDKLKADEVEWRREFADLSSRSFQGQRVDLSCFSGIIGDAEISLGSSVLDAAGLSKRKLKPEEFFALRTDNIGSLHGEHLTDAERPNFGSNIKSPASGRQRLQLIDESRSEDIRIDSNADESKEETLSGSPSLTAIYEMLAEDSPRTIASNIMAYKPKPNILKDTSNCFESRPSEIKRVEDSQSAQIIGTTSQDGRGSISVITLDDTADDLKENKDHSSVQILERSKSSNSYNSDRKMLKSEENTALTLDGSSVPEQDLSWVNIDVRTPELPVHIGAECVAVLCIRNNSSRWLNCDCRLENILWDRMQGVDHRNLARVVFSEKVPLLAPSQHPENDFMLKVLVVPLVHGQLTVVTNIRLQDVVTKDVKNVPCLLHIVSLLPKISVLLHEESADEIDFGTLPEKCSVDFTLTIISGTDRSLELPLNLALQQGSKKTFFLACADVPGSKTNRAKQKKVTSMQHHFCGGLERPFKFKVLFDSPGIDQMGSSFDFLKLSAYLCISMDVPSAKPLLLKKMHIRGCVGRCKLLIGAQSPVILSARWSGQTINRTVPIKNSGVVPLSLGVKILDPTTDGTIRLNRAELSLEPNQEDAIHITFCPGHKFSSPLKRTLVMAIEPNGEMFEVTVIGRISKQAVSDEENSEPADVSSSSSASSVVSRPQSLGSDDAMSGRTSRSSSGRTIVTTQKQLVWGSVPVGKSVTESCSLRNELNTPIKLLMTVYDPTNSYKLLNELGEAVVQRKITLHSLECSTFTVVFSPSKCGAAFGKIKLCEISSRMTTNRLAIPLCGYGGSIKFSIRDVVRDKTGHMCLNLGQVERSLQTHFKIINKGNLGAFALIMHISRGIGPLLQPVVNIEPSEVVVGAGCSVLVEVRYHLHPEDVKFLMKDEREVIEVGMLSILYGDEATRHRLRRIREKRSKEDTDIPNLEKICAPFPGEPVIDVGALNDPETSLQFLYRTFQQQEIALTVEKLADKSFAMQTYVGGGDAAGQGVFFTTMLQDNTTFTCASDESDMYADGTWNVTPSSLTLMIPDIMGGCITLSSKFKEDQMFEAQSSDTFLNIQPSSGIVPAMGETILTITCSAKKKACKATIKVYMENDVKCVPINIKNNKPPEPSPDLQKMDDTSTKKMSPSSKPKDNNLQRKCRKPLPLHCESKNLEFRKTAVGSASVVKCIMRNESANPLQVKVGNLSSPFTTQRTVVPIEGKEVVVLKLYFQPSAAIQYKQDMILSSDGYIPLSISLAGEGVIRS
ncbi:uncharacterized protein spd-2 [Anabrus simplex]|uniref:uncharacterized protein spd-2 n=1 Tax=Anabrus simplex TaxID=316456 RepID=UPI0035A2AED1